MKLLPGQEEEYKKRHSDLWPELKSLLKETGIRDYSVFLDAETNILFGCLVVPSAAVLSRLPEEPVMKKWWAYMQDIMETHPDHSPVQVSLKEMFYLP